MKYVNSFLKRNCAEELVTLFGRTANPMKEITESYGALHHMRGAIHKDNLNFNDFFFMHIGDGSTARTGAMFTFMSKSANVSIDPQTNMTFMEKWSSRFDVDNFNSYGCTWQEYAKYTEGNTSDYINDMLKYDKDHLAIVLVHSHVNTEDVMRAFPQWDYIYVCPCCQKDTQILSTQFIEKNDISVIISGQDRQIMSPENFIIVYRNNKYFEDK